MQISNSEENADKLEQYNRTQKARKNKLNICYGRAHWNACDYIDYNKQNYCEQGCLCWKQDGKHNCCHCTEIDI